MDEAEPLIMFLLFLFFKHHRLGIGLFRKYGLDVGRRGELPIPGLV
jgi:hypothetical protein